MRNAFITLAAVAMPRAAFACTGCFGQNDSPMAWGVNMGIVAMLVVTGGVLAGFASFFIYLVRRSRVSSGDEQAVATAGYLLESSEPQGGTARC